MQNSQELVATPLSQTPNSLQALTWQKLFITTKNKHKTSANCINKTKRCNRQNEQRNNALSKFALPPPPTKLLTSYVPELMLSYEKIEQFRIPSQM